MLWYLLTAWSLCLPLATAVQRSYLQQTLNSAQSSSCSKLAAELPDLVAFPDDAQYQLEQHDYWSLQQQDLNPACRVTPQTVQDFSRAMQILHQNRIDFVIANGKHGTASEASNANSIVTVDLSQLASILFDSEKMLVDIGTGAQWSSVYELLDPFGISIAGARAGSVGVGGFLLGGGLSHSAPLSGWSCDTVEAIELVLANGTILNANSTDHSLLLTALRGGGSGFGVATKFTMRAFRHNELEVGILRYERQQLDQVIKSITEIFENNNNPSSTLDLSITIDEDGNPFAVLMITKYGSILASEDLAPLLKISHTTLQINKARPRDLAADMDVNNPAGYRQHKCTLTIRNDREAAVDIAKEFINATSAAFLREDTGYRSGMLLQALPHSRSHNLLGLDDEQEPLLLMSFEARWSRKTLDSVYTRLPDKTLYRAKEIAEDRGSLHPFIYRNYASAEQDVWMNLRQRNRLDEISLLQSEYDPDHFLLHHLKQPFIDMS